MGVEHVEALEDVSRVVRVALALEGRELRQSKLARAPKGRQILRTARVPVASTSVADFFGLGSAWTVTSRRNRVPNSMLLEKLGQCIVVASKRVSPHSRRLVLLMVIVWAWSLAPRHAEAGDDSTARPWVLRAALGPGYTHHGFGGDDDSAGVSHNGGAVAWDLAVGRRFAWWGALHGTAFGGVVPRATVATVRQSEPDTRDSFRFHALGGGATLRTAWGGFLSPSLGLAMIDGVWYWGPSYGMASQLLLGFHLPLNERLGLGVALQATGVLGFDSTGSLRHGGCLLSLSYE